MRDGEERLAIRCASVEDVDAMLAIKERLAIPVDAGTTTAGGFLLGATREGYEMLVAHANVLLLEDRASREIGGLAVTIPDRLLRASDLWARRRMIVREHDAAEDDFWERIESSAIGYFDQLAVLPGRRYRHFAPALAMAAFIDLVDSGHRHIFATIVREPVHNIAAVPFLEGAGGRIIGTIDEHYPSVGRILSAVYHIDATTPAWTNRETAEGVFRKFRALRE